MATLSNPHYTASVLCKDGTKYIITNILTDMMLDDLEKGIAQKTTIRFKQHKQDGKYLTELINVHDMLYVFANTGSGDEEVFRGYVWEDVYQKDETQEVSLLAYDHLIYLQESEEYKFYSSGKSTEGIFRDLCNEKGIPLNYRHESITHGKLVIKGTLADAFETDLLEEVRKKKGLRGVIRSKKGNLEVFTEGDGNTQVYKLKHGEKGNLLSTKHTVTMNGITTKVIILGSEKDNKAAPIKATVTGDTDKYGTIQKVLYSSDSEKLADLRAEANQTIKDNGKPKKNVEATAIDIPWIRKGDQVYLDDGYVSGYGNVLSISHDVTNKTMSMELRMV